MVERGCYIQTGVGNITGTAGGESREEADTVYLLFCLLASLHYIKRVTVYNYNVTHRYYMNKNKAVGNSLDGRTMDVFCFYPFLFFFVGFT